MKMYWSITVFKSELVKVLTGKKQHQERLD